MPLILTVTNAGRAALVNAANTGTAPVTIAQVGISGNAVTPTPATAALPGEIKRIPTLSGDVVADDTIHLIVRDEGADVFTLRSFALYLADGTLFAIYGQPAVILEKSAQAQMLLAIDVQFADVAANQLTFGDANFLNPPATTERQGVIELATVAEAQAGIDALRALTPASAKAAILGWLLGQDGAGSGLDADLLDGVQGDQYARRDQANSFAGDIATNVSPRPIAVRIPAGGSAGISWQLGGKASFDIVGDASGNLFFNRSNIASGAFVATSLSLGNDGSLAFGGPVFRQGNRVWDAGNDGAGSGLDAGLLAGQQPDFYTNVPARLGYTPANKAGETFTGSVAVAPGNVIGINASSNLGGIQMLPGDAWTSGYVSLFAPNSVRVGYVGFTRIGTAINYVNDHGAGHAFGGGQLSRDGQRVWDAGNDGSGSGLDSDMLDGLHASQFLRSHTGAWVRSEDGKERYFFGQNGATFARTIGYYLFQNQANADVASIDEEGNLWIANQLDAHRLRARSSGDGRAVQIGDDAWIGDANIPNGITVRGGDGRSGYVSFGNSGATLGCNPDDPTLRYNGSRVWDAGNDGSGSGLDADLLDGFQADAFTRVVSQNMSPYDGYRVFADGTKECWTRLDIGMHQHATWNLPVAHGEWVHPTFGLSTAGGVTDVQDNTGITSINGFPPSSITFWNADNRTITIWVRTIGR